MAIAKRRPHPTTPQIPSGFLATSALPAAQTLGSSLQGAGRCWDTSFVADGVQTNTSTQLKAKGP